jgi:hypothetical protein
LVFFERASIVHSSPDSTHVVDANSKKSTQLLITPIHPHRSLLTATGLTMNEEELVAHVLVGLTASPSGSKDTNVEEQGAKVPAKGGKRSRESNSEPGERTRVKRVMKAKIKEKEHCFPVEPRVIQVIKKPMTYINHSYRDFSAVPAELDHVETTDIDKMTFAQKIHHILSQSEYEECIAWMPHGRSFRIPVPIGMEKMGILKKYFGHNRFSSLLRQLNNYGFKHVSQGPDRNSYYHEVRLC